ncbi:MAG: ribosome assembly cofactor RimP [Spirochaetaceae bacterium]|nr:ribosome assembly cofactor RimP [Spirochaetaceae bacterium]
MRCSPRADNPVFDSLEPVVRGLGMVLVELSVSRHRGSAQVRAVVARRGSMGIDDCARVHQAILPRLELAFPGGELHVEVSSPGIDRLIRDGSEFPLWLGRGVACYRVDTGEWVRGILRRADTAGITLGETELDFALIGKAKLDHSVE